MSEGDWIEDEKTVDSGEAMFTELLAMVVLTPTRSSRACYRPACIECGSARRKCGRRKLARTCWRLH